MSVSQKTAAETGLIAKNVIPRSRKGLRCHGICQKGGSRKVSPEVIRSKLLFALKIGAYKIRKLCNHCKR